MTGPVDPSGKRALFSVPLDDDADRPDTDPPRATGDPDGKAALYSAARRRAGTLVLDCSRCKGRTRVSYAEFGKRHLPVWLWFPWREHSRYLVCPACGNRAWVAARWLE